MAHSKPHHNIHICIYIYIYSIEDGDGQFQAPSQYTYIYIYVYSTIDWGWPIPNPWYTYASFQAPSSLSTHHSIWCTSCIYIYIHDAHPILSTCNNWGWPIPNPWYTYASYIYIHIYIYLYCPAAGRGARFCWWPIPTKDSACIIICTSMHLVHPNCINVYICRIIIVQTFVVQLRSHVADCLQLTICCNSLALHRISQPPHKGC